MGAEPLVTIALPVRNGADTIDEVARSVLAQDYERIELLIADNASTDGTEDVARRLAATDDRVRYHRQPENIGLINNFEWAKHDARGEYFRWIGDSDSLRPDHVSRCLAEFTADPRLVLVTTQLEYVTNDGTIETLRYEPPPALRSGDASARLQHWLRLLNDSYQCLDPLYGMVRTEVARSIQQDRMLRGDEVYAVKLVLAGPWGHVPEVLGARHWTGPKPLQLTRLLGLPAWHAAVRDLRQTLVTLELVDGAGFAEHERRRARAAVWQLYAQRHQATIRRRARRLAGMVSGRGRPQSGHSGSIGATGMPAPGNVARKP